MEKLGKYELREVLGRGGMGIVYRAFDPVMDREVALKIVHEKSLDVPETRARFVREARTAGKLSHDNITIIHDLGELDGKMFIVMEYLPGRDLRTVIENKEPLTLQEKLDIARQICRGLHYAHANIIVHRDIKPENIKVLSDGRIKIMDFGIAKPYAPLSEQAVPDTNPVLTRVGMRIGTPWYMSPEQVKGAPVDKRSDIFSFGVLLYELLTYRKPFDGDDTTVLYKILHEEPEPIRLEESGLGMGLQRVLSKCLAKDPQQRYSDCQIVLRDLDTVPVAGVAGRSLAEIIEEGARLVDGRRFDEALLKYNEVLEIDPGNEEARKAIERVRDERQEIAAHAVLSEKIIGEVVSHFRIIERISGGGMGVVYKAEDLTLKRIVALKFLLSEMTGDKVAKRRFLKEARAASALDHPNICTIHEIGETIDGLLFICMAYYPGDNLSKKLEAGPFDIVEALEISIRVARGLARAHENGIVHRDIKPANIIITPGDEVKVVDFGVAKLSSGTRITKAGSLVGTLPYMSPEQVRGLELDARTDIWSLGVLMYQILTGKLPFMGDNEAAVFYSVVNEDPMPASRLRQDLPPELERIVGQALKKNLAERYQSMKLLLADLEDVHRDLTKGEETGRPGEVSRLVERGKSLLNRREYKEALSRFEAALRLAPEDRTILDLRDKCTARLAEASRVHDLVTQAQTFMDKGKFEDARDVLQNTIAIDPDNLEATRLLEKVEGGIEHRVRIDKLMNDVEFYLKRGKMQDAVQCYKEVLKLEPEHKEAARGLKRIEQKQDMLETRGSVRTPIPAPRKRGKRTLLYAGIGVAAVGGIAAFFLLRAPSRPSTTAAVPPNSPDSLRLITVLRDNMTAIRTTAHDAGAEKWAPVFWDGAVASADTAERELNARHFASAGQLFVHAKGLFGEAIEESHRMELASRSGVEELKGLVQTVQKEMLADKDAAEQAGGKKVSASAFKTAQQLEHEGERQVTAGGRESLLAARTSFTRARDGYRNVLTDLRLNEEARSNAETRRTEANAARQNIPGSETEKQANAAFGRGGAAEAEGSRLYKSGDYRGARDAFARAVSLYVTAGAELATARLAAAETASKKTDLKFAEKKEPEKPDPAVREREERETARRDILHMLDAYRASIEQGNLKDLTTLLNLAGDKQQEWTGFFESSEERKVAVDHVDLQITPPDARLNFKVKMSFYNKAANTNQSPEFPRQWTLHQDNGAWKVVTQK
jgi:serine/threonine protein kinase